METYADVFANLVSAGQELPGSRTSCRLVFGSGMRFRVDRELKFGPTLHSAGDLEVCFWAAAIGGDPVAWLWVGTAAGDTVTIEPGKVA
jgi:hypothetical protein